MKDELSKKDKLKSTKLIASKSGITLVALIITIVVLLILARSKYCNSNWG